MTDLYVIEDGIITREINYHVLWYGHFSAARKNGFIIHFLTKCLPKNSICIIPKTDGNIVRDKLSTEFDSGIDWDIIEYYIEKAKQSNKVFILGTLCQIREEPNINYLYLPLDDDFFEKGVSNIISNNLLVDWNYKSSNLCWRGTCSGIYGINSLRAKFVKKINEYEINNNVKLTYCIEGKGLPDNLFSSHIDYTEFFKYKIFFIIDGNCIASNHMWGFATGCIPFLISNAKCWFSEFIIPYVHYIPINYDLSNLFEQIDWVRNNDELAYKISENALNFSKTYFSAEFQQNYIRQNINKFYISYFKEKQIQYIPKIIDTFIFNNETELLFYRLSILYEIVDQFIIVETNNRNINKSLLKKFENKIIYITINLPLNITNSSFNFEEEFIINEEYHFNSIDKGILKLNLNENDIIIISNINEIINPNFLHYIINTKLYNNITINKLSYDSYSQKSTNKCIQSKILKYKYYEPILPYKIRQNNNYSELYISNYNSNQGWYFDKNQDIITDNINLFK